jgi:multiple sugar transport system ATP-binding protein
VNSNRLRQGSGESAEAFAKAEGPGRYLAGIRPHDIDLASPETGDADGCVDVVEPLGAMTLIHVRVERWPGELVRVVVPAETRVAPDDRVGLAFRRDRLHLFDAATGRRLAEGRP